MLQYPACDTFDIIYHFIIPEPQYFVSLVLQPFLSVRIIVNYRFSIMLTTVQFDYQSSIQTYKIYDIVTDRMLSSELITAELSISQLYPEYPFDIGLPVS